MYQCLIARLPYAQHHDPEEIMTYAKQVDMRGLIFLSVPIHTEAPNNGGKLICELESKGLVTVAKIAWRRDRHIVCSKSKRLTNVWEPIAIMSRSKNYIINRDAPAKIKKGYETKESSFNEEEFLTCIGDFWEVSNDRRDRRFLPQTIILTMAQLADLNPSDVILDPHGNPGIKDACKTFGWEYKDGGAKSEVRGVNKVLRKPKQELQELEEEKSV